MASIVLTSIGSSLGNSLLPGLGGRLLGAAGRATGQNLDRQLGLRRPLRDGPRLENLKVHDSRYGIGIPLAFGKIRVAGNVIWTSDLIETTQEETLVGGKGGAIGAATGSRTTYRYSVHLALGLCAGPVGGIATIWADNKVIYQDGQWQSGIVTSASFYTGTTTQNADPLMQSYLGSDQVPAYRGLAYVVLEGLQLAAFGNRLPNITVEIQPDTATSAPQWLGIATDAAVNLRADTVRNKGMEPIRLVGSTTGVNQCLIGGFTGTGSGISTFKVALYDVSNEAPVKLYEISSTSFTVSSIGDCSWAMAPDGRFVAIYIKDDTGSPSHRLMIYDSSSKQFGAILPLNLAATAAHKQIAWIDAQHCVLIDSNANQLGLRVLARAGRDLVDLGFYDVWGINSTSTYSLVFYTQFTPIQSGLLFFTSIITATTISYFIRPIFWQNNTLVVGSSYPLALNLPLPTGSGSQSMLLPSGDEEWTLYYATVGTMWLMSFRPTATSAIITRPWQALTSTVVSVSTTAHPVIYGNRLAVLQKGSSENFYRLTEIALNEANFSLVSDAVAVTSNMTAVSDFGAYRLDNSRMLVLGISGFYDTLSLLGILQRRETGQSLALIVSTLLQRAGYNASDYNLSALAGLSVDGYVVAEPMAAKDGLAPLEAFARFSLIESDGQLVAVRPSVTAIAEIPLEETASLAAADTTPPSYERRRLQETSLPREITLNYLDASRDYEVGSQRARRLSSPSAIRVLKLDLPLVCTATQAKRVAEQRLYEAWSEREAISFHLSRRWLTLDSGDVVRFDGLLVRITDLQWREGRLRVRGKILPPEITAASEAKGDVGTTTGKSVSDVLLNKLYLCDLPLLRAEDDQPGFYVAMSGLAGWPGGTLWRASDAVNFTNLATFSAAAVAGIALASLATGSPYYMDRANSVNVQLLQGTLASCGDDDLLNGANVALLGNELIQFQTATLLGPGLYRLSNLLRGRRGTEAGITQHVAGEDFILLRQGAVQFVPALLTDRNRSYAFRGVTAGLNVGLQPDQNFSYALKTLEPLAPTHLKGVRAAGSGSDLTISWVRRARRNADWVDYIDVPLDEASEAYELEIVNGSNVLRSFAVNGTTTQLYTAAQQAADWGVVPASFTVNLCQISARYGRGAKTTAIL